MKYYDLDTTTSPWSAGTARAMKFANTSRGIDATSSCAKRGAAGRDHTRSGHLSRVSNDSRDAAKVPAACRNGRTSDCSMATQACRMYGTSTWVPGIPLGDLAARSTLFLSTSAAVCRTCTGQLAGTIREVCTPTASPQPYTASIRHVYSHCRGIC